MVFIKSFTIFFFFTDQYFLDSSWMMAGVTIWSRKWTKPGKTDWM